MAFGGGGDGRGGVTSFPPFQQHAAFFLPGFQVFMLVKQ